MKNIKRFILHILYPTKCPVCGSFIDYMEDFCNNCRKNINIYNEEFSIDGADGFTAAFCYDKYISPAVMLLKRGICGNADYALGKALAERIAQDGISSKAELIIPVPLHKKAAFERGYNQAELIGREVSKRLGIPLSTKAVVKHKNTKEQKSLSAEERRVNLKSAFNAVRPELFKGKRVILLDDVCTTGSTLAELVKLLKENGAVAVYCASVCKTPSLKEKGDKNEY